MSGAPGKAARARLAPLWNCECSNPEGVEMGLAQDGANRGPRFAPPLRELGWVAESWVGWLY